MTKNFAHLTSRLALTAAAVLLFLGNVSVQTVRLNVVAYPTQAGLRTPPSALAHSRSTWNSEFCMKYAQSAIGRSNRF
jgi:hypothetical protein